MILIGLFILIITIVISINIYKFHQSSYHKVTGNSFLATKFDKGRNGEYEIYRRLFPLEKQGAKFLFNVYLPKNNGETTEIDVLMIAKKGIIVFESKNYSGWIFGNEKKQKLDTNTATRER